ncbi:MAG: alginate export family protein [Verrucomicrobiota bacterium]
MKTKAQAAAIFALAGALISVRGQAAVQTTPVPAAVPALSATEQKIQDIKNPFPWMSWGGDLRIRNEYFNDLLTLSEKNPLHEQDYFRFRGRVFTSITPVDDLSLNARLTAEPREWMKPAGYTAYKGNEGMAWYYGIFDALNVQWKNIASLPLTVTVGRQDLFLGDGWLVAEGTPYDGSWTLFLDSARVSYNFKEQHTVVEAIGIIQDAYNNGWMPIINASGATTLTEQNEKGAILSVANSSLPAANLTGYFIYKHDDYVVKYGDNADIFTLGGRLSGTFQDCWKYSVEGAYQCGQKEDPGLNRGGLNPYLSPSAQAVGFRDLNAFAANSKLTYQFNDPLNNQLSLSYEFISGDNSGTRNDEMFDVLWGRWPRWSEIGLYIYAPEARVGQEGNLNRVGPTWSLNPMKNMLFTTSYYALFSSQDAATRAVAPGLFTQGGNFRGHFVQAVMKYTFSKHLSGHLWGEALFPGDYYVIRTVIPFLRAEVTLTF